MPLKDLEHDIQISLADTTPVLNYVLAFGMFVAAFALRMVLEDALPPGFPFLTFFPAIVLVTYYLGTKPGVFCAVLSFLASWYYFLPPRFAFHLNGQTVITLGFFIFIVVVDIVIIDRMVKATRALALAKTHALRLARQRDELFIELQHRVGNNLAMVSAMLKVQARALPQEAAREALESASGRIAIIAEINRLFHNPNQTRNLMDTTFLATLAEKCLHANGAESRIFVNAMAQPLELPQDIFMPVALIVAESVNNAIEHGFGDAGRGTITLEGRMANGQYEIAISDTGAGLPNEFDLAKTSSIGLKLVRSFVTQINGTYEIACGLQTTSRLTFPVPDPAKA